MQHVRKECWVLPVSPTFKDQNKGCISDIHTTSLKWPFKHEHQLITFASQKDTMLFMAFYGWLPYEMFTEGLLSFDSDSGDADI